MINVLFAVVSLWIATATITNHKSDDGSQGEDKLIVVIFSSLSDFNKSVTATLNESIALMAGNLKLEFYDLVSSGCDDQTIPALSVLIRKQIFHKSMSKVAVGIVGPSCTDAAYAVAKLIKRSKANVGHLHTSPMPAPLAVHNTTHGLLSPTDLLADACVALIKYANWSQVLALYQDSLTDMNYIFLQFQRQLQDMDLHIDIINYSNNNNSCRSNDNIRTLGFTSSLQNVNLSRVLSGHSIRILFLMMDAELARNILCQAFMLKAYHPIYQWVIVEITLSDILLVDKVYMESHVCDKKNILKVLKSAVFVNFQLKVSKNNILSSRVNNKDESMLFLYESSIKAMSTILINEQADNGTTGFNYESLPTFPREVSIKQIHDNISVQIFLYSTLTSSLRNVSENISLISSEVMVRLKVIDLATAVIFFSMNFVILVMSMILQVLTFVFRQEQSVKASSTFLLHFSYVGIYMLNQASNIPYIQALFDITSESVFSALCCIGIIMGSNGLTFVLGTLTMKTWRLYKIFVHPMNPGKFLSDKPLLLFVWCLILIDYVICIPWFVFDSIVRKYEESSHNKLEGVIICRSKCFSKAFIPLFMLVMGYHAVMMAVIVWLMCNTRKKIPKVHKNIQTAHLVMKLVYTLLFVFSSGIIGSWVAHSRELHLFEFVMMGLFFESLQASFLLFLLLPPLLPVFKQLWNKN